MPDQLETVTLHAARRDTDGHFWFQFGPTGRWVIDLDGTDGFETLEELEASWGPTREVRIVTTDPTDPAAIQRGMPGLSEQLDRRQAVIDAAIAWRWHLSLVELVEAETVGREAEALIRAVDQLTGQAGDGSVPDA